MLARPRVVEPPDAGAGGRGLPGGALVAPAPAHEVRALAGVPREEVVAVPLVVEAIDPLGGRRLRHRGQHDQGEKRQQHGNGM